MESVAVMLYDGDCAFCRHWIDRWRRMTGDRVRYEPYQRVLAQYPQVREDECVHAVQLILAEGTVFSGAHGVLRALALNGSSQRLLSLYERSRMFARLSEWCYQKVATSRSFLSRFYQMPQCPR